MPLALQPWLPAPPPGGGGQLLSVNRAGPRGWRHAVLGGGSQLQLQLMVPVRFRDAIVRMLSVSIECSSLQRSVCSSNVNGAQHDTALFSVGGMPAGSGLRSV